jgi:hypothetical protein
MNQTTPITGSFLWTYEEVKAAHKALAEIKPLTKKPFIPDWLLNTILLTIALGFLFWYLGYKNQENPLSFKIDPLTLGVILLPGIVFWIIFKIFPRYNLKQAFLKSPDRDKHVAIRISADAISMSVGDLREIKWNWSGITEVRRSPKGFCFFQDKHAGFWIPLHAFKSPGDIETISQMARDLTPKFTVTIR